MAWPFNKKPPEGETEEQRKAREDQAEQDFLAKVGLAVEEKLKPISEKVGAMETRWTALETDATREAEEERRRREAEGLTDEEKQRRADAADKNKLLALTILTNARITESEVLTEVRAKFPEFETKIKEIYANTPIEKKGEANYANYCRNVMKMVVGEAALAGGLRYDSTSKQFFLEDATGKGGGETYDFLASDVTWKDPKSGRVLTGRQQLEKLGINPKDFAESQKNGVV